MRLLWLLIFFIVEFCVAQDSISYLNKKSKNKIKSTAFFNSKIENLTASNNLEEYYYAHFDFFLQNAVKQNLSFLKPQKPWRKPQNNNEKIAKLHVQINLAYHLFQFGNIEESIAEYEKAFFYFKSEKIHNYDIVDYLLKPLSNHYTRIGDFAKAEEVLKYTIDYVKNDYSKLIGAYINLSILYQSINKIDKAIEVLHLANKIKNIGKENKTIINVELAKNYLKSNQFQVAINYINKTIKLNPSNKILHQVLIVQGMFFYKNKNYVKALDSFQSALNLSTNIFENKSRETAKNHVLIAQTYYQLNENKKSLINYQSSIQSLTNFKPKNEFDLPLVDLLFAENIFIDIFEGIALVLNKESKKEKSLQALNLANNVANRIQINLSSQQSKLLHQTNTKKRISKIVHTCYDLFLQNNDSKWLYKALMFIENTKSNVLQEELLSKANLSKNKFLLEIKKLKKEKAKIQTQIAIEQNKQAKANLNQIKKWNNKKVDLDTKLQVLKNQLTNKQFFLNEKKSFNIYNFKKAGMLNDHLLISYFETKNFWYVFYIDDNSKLNWSRILNTKELKRHIQNYIHVFANVNDFNNNIESYKQSAFYLYQKLIQPFEKREYKNITIIPDGKLNFVSFDALLQNIPNGFNFENYPFLVKKYIINSGFSLQVLQHQKEKEQKNGGNMTLGYFPVFINNENNQQTLKYTTTEKEGLLKYTNALIREEKDATKKVFLKEVNQYQNIHLSTHATAGDFYRSAKIQFIDEPLYLSEIYGLNLKNELLVLSACETGIGKIQNGEGVMSLARGFAYAGINKIIVSLWKVNDKSTSILMNSFYKFKQNNSTEKALQLAKLEYLQNKNISNIKKAPYYWSAFVSIGNLDQTTQNNNRKYIIVLLLFTIVGSILWNKKRIRIN